MAEVLPGEKVVEEKQTKRRRVGDGINDVPPLAQVDIRIASGAGNYLAITASPITLISGDLPGVAIANNSSIKILKTNI